ncbi:MAG: A/G-specific adenine glycosylase [Candidatus Kerfeldbacteria bacterium]|nr:A/G-specific adenine glycosylase [Candidatus Kerfeldbacteria bacterium]
MTGTSVKKIRRALLRWFAQTKRDLPWRHTSNPYRILVSEVMLQQTQVDRVKPKYEAFLKRWPTVRHLARARRSSVVRQWAGLGYNRRAVQLHRAAKAIVAEHNGIVPRTVAELEQLPGIGPYTARAVLSFAHNASHAFIDTNVRRVVGRVALGTHFPTPNDDRVIRSQAERLAPKQHAGAWHAGLMDLGATVCKPKPLCPVCPLQSWCRAYPTILRKPQKRPARRQVPFADSNRYWRGQIVSLLRHASGDGRTVAELRKRLSRLLPKERVETLLHGLQKDGLVETRGRRYQLTN